MINYIKGRLDYIGEGFIIIENNSIGYSIQVTARTQSNLIKTGIEVKIFTYMNVKEDEISLFGFLTYEELKIFKLLITVSGIGPKGALSLLNCLTPDKLSLAIITNDLKALKQAVGVGDKAAKRIVLELSNKIETTEALPVVDSVVLADNSETEDAISALTVLGFSKSEVIKAVSEVYSEGMTSSKIISTALKKLS